MEKLSNRIQHIYEIPTYTQNKRRGLINGIGSISKTLFGTMDASDAEEINAHFAEVDSKQDTLQRAMKKQIQLTNTTLGHLQQVEIAIQRNEDLLNNQMKDLQIRNIANMAEQNKRTTLSDHFMTLNSLLVDLTEDVNDVTQYCSQLKSGTIDPSILSRGEVSRLLQTAAQQLPNGLMFPITPTPENAHVIEEISSIVAYYDKRTLITVIKVPLISTQMYSVMEVTPVPVHVRDNIYALLVIHSSTMIIDTESNQYIIADAQELKKCKKFLNQYYCEQPMVIHRLTDILECEVNLWLKPADKFPTNCETKYITANNTLWISTPQPATWIYATHEPDTVTIQCEGSKTFRTTITQSGIITLKNNCKISSKEVILRNKKTVHEQDYVIKTAPLYKLNTELTGLVNTAKPLTQVQLDRIIKDPSEFSQLYKQLDQIDNNLSEESRNTNIPIWHIVYPSATTILIITIIILAIIIYLVLRRKKTTGSEVRATYIPPELKNSN